MPWPWPALALFATLAHAEDYLSPTEERVRVSIGVVRVSNDTNLQLDSSTGVPGTPINAEQDLGLDKTDFEAKLQAMVRVGERHRLRFDYFSLDRTGQTIATKPIIFRDVVLQPGDPLDSSMSIRTFGISYEYSFLHTDATSSPPPSASMKPTSPCAFASPRRRGTSINPRIRPVLSRQSDSTPPT